MFPQTVFLVLTIVHIALCKEIGLSERDPRWFNGAYTSTVLESTTVTSLVPSSCVLVEPSLPPCRNVRYLKFPHFISDFRAVDNLLKEAGESDSTEKVPEIKTTTLGWGEYLGLYAPTVTVTSTRISTKVLSDPRVVVTFAVKGCRPIKLPVDMDRCVVPTTIETPIPEIVPTKTVGLDSSTTQYPELSAAYQETPINELEEETQPL